MLFQDLLVWSNQSPVDSICAHNGNAVHHACLIVILLLVHSAELASLATTDGGVLTPGIDALLLDSAPD